MNLCQFLSWSILTFNAYLPTMIKVCISFHKVIIIINRNKFNCTDRSYHNSLKHKFTYLLDLQFYPETKLET
jgi:hypothetical protein